MTLKQRDLGRLHQHGQTLLPTVLTKAGWAEDNHSGKLTQKDPKVTHFRSAFPTWSNSFTHNLDEGLRVEDNHPGSLT